jgi:hypothetical protein
MTNDLTAGGRIAEILQDGIAAQAQFFIASVVVRRP